MSILIFDHWPEQIGSDENIWFMRRYGANVHDEPFYPKSMRLHKVKCGRIAAAKRLTDTRFL